MIRAAPILASLAGALTLHLAVLARFDLPQGASGAGGQSGRDLLALEAAPGDLAALVAAWDVPPAPADVPAAPRGASADHAASVPHLPAAPAPPPLPAAVAPTLPDLPAAEAPPPPTSAPSPPPEPVAPHVAATAPTSAPMSAPPPAPRPNQRAAGEGQGAGAGDTGTAAAATAAEAVRQSALMAWGAEVRAAVERRKRTPAAAFGAEGAVTLIMQVSRDGALRAVTLSAGSGTAALDDAALAAARAAAPFGPAPAPLTAPVYALRLTLRFQR
ncbi:MAG: TonB family protein [Rhodobacteraceae bacterium]|nr:TonB family protein [Paracoccaceae bacterium]